MKTTAVTSEDLGRSVLAVPPLAWQADFMPEREANRALIRHLEAGGVSTLLYGGNANLYNIAVRDYAPLLESLIDTVAPETWLIPSVGPDYGKMMDQAAIVRDLGFPTAMVLPLGFPATPTGIEVGLRRFAEAFGRPIIVYVKAEGYLEPRALAGLAADGLLAAVKYAVVRADPAEDDYLRRLLDSVDRSRVISGIGERPAIVHLRRFGLAGFTSGSVCIAPGASMALLHALQAGDEARAEALRAKFLAFENQRDAISPLRVLHDAVGLAGIADMGPILPLLSSLTPAERGPVAAAAKALLAFERELAGATAAA